jgi:rRNA maturation RNase YbeY
MPVQFHSQNITFSLKKITVLRKLILSLIRKEKKKAGKINFVFTNDPFLFELNKKFLKHNTLTDIITFQYPSTELTGEIYISVPRVRENAEKLNVSFENELHRVMVHGTLHLCGYKDKKPGEKKKMREKENYYLNPVK